MSPPPTTGESEPAGAFLPRPRRATRKRTGHDAANIRAELEGILARTAAVAASDPAQFSDGAPAYDIASMAVIRFAALLERPEFEPWAALLSADEREGIRVTRNIAAHAGYPGMNDRLFWSAVTARLPEILHRLLAADVAPPA